LQKVSAKDPHPLLPLGTDGMHSAGWHTPSKLMTKPSPHTVPLHAVSMAPPHTVVVDVDVVLVELEVLVLLLDVVVLLVEVVVIIVVDDVLVSFMMTTLLSVFVAYMATGIRTIKTNARTIIPALLVASFSPFLFNSLNLSILPSGL